MVLCFGIDAPREHGQKLSQTSFKNNKNQNQNQNKTLFIQINEVLLEMHLGYVVHIPVTVPHRRGLERTRRREIVLARVVGEQGRTQLIVLVRGVLVVGERARLARRVVELLRVRLSQTRRGYCGCRSLRFLAAAETLFRVSTKNIYNRLEKKATNKKYSNFLYIKINMFFFYA